MNDVERKANLQSSTNYLMREIRAERYETSQARFGNRSEKNNRRKRTQEGEGKNKFY